MARRLDSSLRCVALPAVIQLSPEVHSELVASAGFYTVQGCAAEVSRKRQRVRPIKRGTVGRPHPHSRVIA